MIESRLIKIATESAEFATLCMDRLAPRKMIIKFIHQDLKSIEYLCDYAKINPFLYI